MKGREKKVFFSTSLRFPASAVVIAEKKKGPLLPIRLFPSIFCCLMVGEGRKDVSFSFCSATPKRGRGTEKLKAILSRSLPFLLLICIP